MAQGRFHAPTFVTAVNASVPEPNGSSIPPHQPPNELHTINFSPLASSLLAPNIVLGPEKAFSLGRGRAPIPPKLVTKILSSKFVDLSELLPENLDEPLSDTTSFTIENSTIMSVSRSSRERKTDLDILSWVECFNSYISVIPTYRPHRAGDLLAYMALIIRTPTRFGGKAWFHYDRAFRREAEVNNVQDWSVMRTDLYNFHTLAATRAPDVHPYIRHQTVPNFAYLGTKAPVSLQEQPVDFAMHATSVAAVNRIAELTTTMPKVGTSADAHPNERTGVRPCDPKTNFPFIDSSSSLS